MLMRTGSKNVKNEIEVLFLLKMIAILFPFTLSVIEDIEEGMSCESDHDLISKESSSCSKYVWNFWQEVRSVFLTKELGGSVSEKCKEGRKKGNPIKGIMVSSFCSGY